VQKANPLTSVMPICAPLPKWLAAIRVPVLRISTPVPIAEISRFVVVNVTTGCACAAGPWPKTSAPYRQTEGELFGDNPGMLDQGYGTNSGLSLIA
jgi:hypothetical protein